MIFENRKPNVTLISKFRKYNTAFNSGLKIWLVPDFPTENPLLNGMFCYICNGLVLHLRHIFKPRNVMQQLTHEPLTRNKYFEIYVKEFPKFLFQDNHLYKSYRYLMKNKLNNRQ